MNQYVIEFTDGSDDKFDADAVTYDHDKSMFYLQDTAGVTVAWVPDINVRSVRLAATA